MEAHIDKIGTDVERAAGILAEGGIVAIPTETVYGLAANAMDESAILKVFKAKQRPFFDPLIVHVSSLESIAPMIEEADHEALFGLAEKFWPGPLSLIVRKKRPGLSDMITAGHDTVALRRPAHPMTADLLNRLEFPLVAPSANPFGYVSPTTAQHVAAQLADKVDYILDGGPTRVGVESTILDLTTRPFLVRRKGGLTLEKLREVLPDISVADTSVSDPTSPGRLESHYAPGIKMSLTPIEEALKYYPAERVGGLFFSKLSPDLEERNQRVLSPGEDLGEAALNLFAYIRELDALDLDIIVAELVPDEGLGLAINDKLRRASA
jgi:L-threonylcarbamoyladenylate synthase